jgi:protein-S-isoprenylcysteine O-methyltransferase Ste14
MLLAFPISVIQLWAFWALGLIFFLFLIRAYANRKSESGVRYDGRSRTGIVLQGLAMGLAAFGPVRPSLGRFSPAGLLGTLAVILLMSGAIALFATSSRELGRNWSVVARMRSDHELIRTGPYARVRHPIYLGLLLFLLAFAIAYGHWLQLVVAMPLYLAGTTIRTRVEDGLLERKFGDAFRDYRRSTPALIPKL